MASFTTNLPYIYHNASKDLEETINILKEEPLLAIDCEGVNLNRKGELTIVTVATPEMVHIFDVKELKHVLFDKGLQELLEASDKEKLMFDCRNDSDALFHQYQVKVQGILDLQLMDCMYRMENGSMRQFMNGYKKCLERYLNEPNLVNVKSSGSDFLNQKAYKWAERPLPKQMLEYAAGDVLGLFPLYDHYKNMEKPGLVKERVLLASSRYAAMWRDKPKRSLDNYEFNARLPQCIIPNMIGNRLDTTPPNIQYNAIECNKCRRKFPYAETTVLCRRSRVRVCRVCKKIYQENDD